MIPDFGVMAGQAILDVVTHEHDVRHALGAPGARDSDAVLIGSALEPRSGSPHAAAHDGPGTLRVETDLWSHTYGDGEPTLTLGVVRVRAASAPRPAGAAPRRSRRTTGRARRRPELVVLAIFTPRAEDFDG